MLNILASYMQYFLLELFIHLMYMVNDHISLLPALLNLNIPCTALDEASTPVQAPVKSAKKHFVLEICPCHAFASE